MSCAAVAQINKLSAYIVTIANATTLKKLILFWEARGIPPALVMQQRGEALSPTVVSFINIFASTSVAMICTIEEASPSIRAKQDDTGTKKNKACHNE